MLPRLYSIVLGLTVCARFIEPAPLVAPAGFSLTREASGLDGARNLRLVADGVLLADSADPALRYEIHPAHGAEPAIAMSVAPALLSAGPTHRFTADHNPLQLRWDAQAAQLTFEAPADTATPTYPIAPQAAHIARVFNAQRHLSAVALPDGTVFVVDASAGLGYRVAPRP